MSDFGGSEVTAEATDYLGRYPPCLLAMIYDRPRVCRRLSPPACPACIPARRVSESGIGSGGAWENPMLSVDASSPFGDYFGALPRFDFVVVVVVVIVGKLD